MPKFVVYTSVRATLHETWGVTAESPEEAARLVLDGEDQDGRVKFLGEENVGDEEDRLIRQTEPDDEDDEDDEPEDENGAFPDLPAVPADFPVKVLGPDDPAQERATCLTCHRSWDDAIPTMWTPAPSARCPFEDFH